MGGEDAAFLQLDEKTPEALLQFGIGITGALRSVRGRLWSRDFGLYGAANATPLFVTVIPNFLRETQERQYLMGSFGGALSLN